MIAQSAALSLSNWKSKVLDWFTHVLATWKGLVYESVVRHRHEGKCKRVAIH